MKNIPILLALTTTVALAQGPLAPDAAPGPLMKTLDQIEPRIAINATNTPGDADNLFNITQPGSYYLTGNITGVAGKSGIKIATDNVTLDLMGHSLLGIPGSLTGIVAQSGPPEIPFKNLTVRNGIVTKWGGNGLTLNTDAALVERIHASDNGNNGIYVNGTGGIVRLCSAMRNTSVGIYVSANALIEACFSSGNGLGIITSFRSSVTGCNASFNITGSGISVEGSSMVTTCTVVGNRLDGIRVTSSCLVTDNLCSGNGNGAEDGAGIRVSYDKNRIEGNHCIGADRGIDVDLAGNIIFKNTCSGNTINWDIVANNVFGPIIDRTAPASAAVSGNSAPDSSDSTHPNANFTY